MKLISYYGAEGDSIVIESSKDLYPALDFIQNRMIELQEEKGQDNERCIEVISQMMDEAEQLGFGNYEDIEKIKYS